MEHCLDEGRDDYERTIVFGERAINHIKSHRTSAYPRIYELWYTFVTGHNAPLNKASTAVERSPNDVSDQEIEEIYDNYLSPLRFSDRVDQVGSRLMGEIDQVMSMVETAVDRRALTARSSAAPSAPRHTERDPRAAARHRRQPVRVTREMEVSNKILEVRLQEIHATRSSRSRTT